jgi:hypothetical protein
MGRLPTCAALPAFAFALALTAAGCERQLNPLYCATHPDDGDCQDAGLVVIDAPPPECQASADCTAPGLGVCDTSVGMCVECTPEEAQACQDPTPRCGADRRCHGCIHDEDCTESHVCLPTGTCAAVSSVLYVRPGATPDGGDCTLPTAGTKCSLAKALGRAADPGTGRSIIKMDPGAYPEGPFALSGVIVRIHAHGAVISNAGDGNVFTLVGGMFAFVGGRIEGSRGANSNGISCTNNGSVALHGATIQNHVARGVVTTGCVAVIEGNRFTGNPLGALAASAAKVSIINNFFYGNGGNGVTANGNVAITNASGVFVFNSVAYNNAANGGQNNGGVTCSAASGETLVAAHNIIAGNNPKQNQVGGTCAYVNSYINQSADNVAFVSTTDLHLTANTPRVQPSIRDSPGATNECRRADGSYILDIDHDLRPVDGLCDLGADEYKP